MKKTYSALFLSALSVLAPLAAGSTPSNPNDTNANSNNPRNNRPGSGRDSIAMDNDNRDDTSTDNQKNKKTSDMRYCATGATGAKQRSSNDQIVWGNDSNQSLENRDGEASQRGNASRQQNLDGRQVNR